MRRHAAPVIATLEAAVLLLTNSTIPLVNEQRNLKGKPGPKDNRLMSREFISSTYTLGLTKAYFGYPYINTRCTYNIRGSIIR